MFGEHPAAAAVTYTGGSLGERLRQRGRAVTIPLEQLERDALCRFSANARHATQCVDQLNQQR